MSDSSEKEIEEIIQCPSELASLIELDEPVRLGKSVRKGIVQIACDKAGYSEAAGTVDSVGLFRDPGSLVGREHFTVALGFFGATPAEGRGLFEGVVGITREELERAGVVLAQV